MKETPESDITREAREFKLKAFRLFQELLTKHVSVIEQGKLPSEVPWENEIYELIDIVEAKLFPQSHERKHRHSARWYDGMEHDIQERRVEAVQEIWTFLCAFVGDYLTEKEISKIKLKAKLGDPT